MVAVKQLLVAACMCIAFICFGMDSASAHPMGMFGGGHHGSDIAPLLAAGIIVSMLQHHG